jgi:3-hydroxyacyl-CoA dehydrogenase/enoyl-CoA hydratase/3-hydroxybutyryl-CoA epimerase/3-hydroxyacyl-CoA dehydrogenase/enoyl-CoA hydratase/3-hydroxybutyryl-CoA epimerase/enoyl-CoA isomerase
MADGLARPERFCGLHFFNPVRKMPLVEVIRGEKTSDETIATAVAYAKQIGKSPVVVRDAPGFLVNRILFPYLNEALQLVIEGASLRQIDKAATSFGMPMGPITLLDVVGLDVAVHAGLVMYEAFPDRTIPSELLTALYKGGRLGQKVGKGFFTYGGKQKKGADDPEVTRMIADRLRQERSFTPEELRDRLFLPMLLEATRVLEDQLVRDVRDVDLGLIFGIGFPPFRGGLLFWADTVGPSTLLERLKPLVKLGKRYEPTEFLSELVAQGETFYSDC